MHTPTKCAGLLCVVALQARALVIVNGGFEDPQVTSNLNFVGPYSFPGWTAFSTGSGGNAGIARDTDFGLTPYAGDQMFGFNGVNPPAGSWVEQTFATQAGTTYSVEFAVGRNNGFGWQFLQLQAEIFGAGDALIATASAVPPPTVGWQVSSFDFVADASTTRLRFTDTSGANPNTDLFLDAVTVTAAPITNVPDSGMTALLVTVGALALLWGRMTRTR